MSNGNGAPTVRLWQVFIGQIPWVLTILALGAWKASAFESRLAALERSTARIEVRQQQAQDEQLQALKDEVARLRRAVVR